MVIQWKHIQHIYSVLDKISVRTILNQCSFGRLIHKKPLMCERAEINQISKYYQIR